MNQDLNQRPDLPSDKLMAVTNELARWLPGGEETPALSKVEAAVVPGFSDGSDTPTCRVSLPQYGQFWVC